MERKAIIYGYEDFLFKTLGVFLFIIGGSHFIIELLVLLDITVTP